MNGQTYEKSDVSPGRIALVAGVLLIVLALSIALVFWLVHGLQPGIRGVSDRFPGQQDRDGPRLEVDPSADRAALENPVAQRLETFGWTDKAARHAHIPIERAMQLLVKQGWPDQDLGGTGP